MWPTRYARSSSRTAEATGQFKQAAESKDLVDIAIIARSQAIGGVALRAALLTGAAHRGLTLPPKFDVPDLEAWQTGYVRRAHDVPGQAPTFDEAIDLARHLLDPVFSRTCGSGLESRHLPMGYLIRTVIVLLPGSAVCANPAAPDTMRYSKGAHMAVDLHEPALHGTSGHCSASAGPLF